ncbi:MAG TPA: alkaline phosphatase family protein [Planctomycetes bacterium]|nr:alkaline phosphatase family protein [Planctomycetota bacterium]
MRRTLGLALALLAATQLAAQDSGPLAAGPMVGHATETQVRFWVQTRSAADVAIRFWPRGKKARARTTPTVRSIAPQAFCVHLKAEDLPFGTHFEYEVLVDGKAVDVAWPLRFQTQPHWRFRTDPPEFTAAIGSCAFINDPPNDRPGRPYGGDPKIFTAMAKVSPDLMVWLGDNVYYREMDWTSESGMRRRYSFNRRTPELQPFLGSTSHYAIWDDHDYGPNNSDWTFALKDASLRTFKLFWENPTYGAADMKGTMTRFTWGDAEFFLLDGRWNRSPERAPKSSKKTILGRRQLDWLIDGLTSSSATFKIVVSGSQVLNPLCFYEGWGDFPTDRQRLLDALRERRIPGVLFLSGDRHHTELIRLDDDGFYPLYDYTSSPLLSNTHAPGREAENRSRVPGTFVTDRRNFGLLEFSGPRNERVLTLRCLDSDGRMIWERAIPAKSLRP